MGGDYAQVKNERETNTARLQRRQAVISKGQGGYVNSCGKMSFISKKEVRRYIARSRKDDGIKGKLFAYDCPRCQYWHMTRMTKKQQRLKFKQT